MKIFFRFMIWDEQSHLKGNPPPYLFRALAWGLYTCSIRCGFLIADSGEKWRCP